MAVTTMRRRTGGSESHSNLEDPLILVGLAIAEAAHCDLVTQSDENQPIKHLPAETYTHLLTVDSTSMAQQSLGIVRGLVGALTWALPFTAAKVFGLR
jgi:hypothetical protein